MLRATSSPPPLPQVPAGLSFHLFLLVSLSCYSSVSLSLSLMCLSLQSLSPPPSPFSCPVPISDMDSRCLSLESCVSLHLTLYFSCSPNGKSQPEQRSEGPGPGQLSRRGGPRRAPQPSSLHRAGCSPGSLCFLSTGVWGPRAEGPSCLSSGETCVQMLALWL